MKLKFLSYTTVSLFLVHFTTAVFTKQPNILWDNPCKNKRPRHFLSFVHKMAPNKICHMRFHKNCMEYTIQYLLFSRYKLQKQGIRKTMFYSQTKYRTTNQRYKKISTILKFHEYVNFHIKSVHILKMVQ